MLVRSVRRGSAVARGAALPRARAIAPRTALSSSSPSIMERANAATDAALDRVGFSSKAFSPMPDASEDAKGLPAVPDLAHGAATPTAEFVVSGLDQVSSSPSSSSSSSSLAARPR